MKKTILIAAILMASNVMAETPASANQSQSELYPYTAKARATAQALRDKDNALPTIDMTLTDEEKAIETKQIVKDLKKIPVSEFKKNLELYMKLVAYNPDVDRYSKKVEFYKTKWDANKLEIEKKEKAEREERRLSASYPNWTYNTWEDDMTSKTIKQASVLSINTLNLGSPYSGTQHATLIMRKHPRWGKDVMLQIEKGQFACHRNHKNKVLVRFDDGKPMTFRCLEPEDNSSTLIFIQGYSKFVSRAKKAKKIRISRNIYQNGSPTMEFYVKGLKW